MIKWAKYLKAGIALFSAVKDGVEAVEVPGLGPAKKAAVLECIAHLHDVGSICLGEIIPKEAVLSLASEFVDVIVALKNLTGAFRHSQDPRFPSWSPPGAD